MDFSAGSPSHTLLVACVAVGFVVQIGISLYRVGQLDKRLDNTDAKIDALGISDWKGKVLWLLKILAIGCER